MSMEIDKNKRLLKLLKERMEAPSKSKKEDNEDDENKKGDLKAKHDRVEGLLQNNVFNHAGVMEELWGDSDATSRSLFRKKLHREKNENDVPYEFDDEELSKIANILMDTSKKVTKAFAK